MTLSGIGDRPLFKRRNTGADELEALLDLLPNPTLVADARTGRVLFANAPVSLLSAYTRHELAELELHTLLPDLALKDLEKRTSTSNQKLITRSSRNLTIQVRTDALGGPDHWVAVTLITPSSARVDPQQDHQRWSALHALSLAAQEDDLGESFRLILEASAMLTGADALALYKPGKAKLELDSTHGDTFEFPHELAEQELANLASPKVWQPGRPIESALHKAAHAAKLSFIASTPLGEGNPGAGLLALASREAAPAKELLIGMQILAATAATAVAKAKVDYALQREVSRLAESEELGVSLKDHVQDGLLFADADLKVLEINPAAEAMLGYASTEVSGRAANDILISTQPLLPILEAAMADGKPVELGERKLHRRDGTDFLAFIRVAPVTVDERAQKLAVIFTDLSEHEAFHLQSQQLQQRAWLGEITAYFAHEVRNPINNISTGLQLMQISLPEQDPMQEQIRRLQEDCDRLEHRMKSVLNFSRNLEHNPEPMDLGEFCRSQLDRWRPRMARKNIQDHLQIAAGTPAIYGDKKALDQVFTNLITNAIQAMQEQENGVIAMKIRPNPDDDSMVDVHFSDNGPGIPEELRKRVFEPFFTTKNQEGTGLGLAITRRIVMMHKGKIDLESFPGGTLFKIQLPVAPSAPVEGPTE
jgi:two-component system sensor histidine kinase AtoS